MKTKTPKTTATNCGSEKPLNSADLAEKIASALLAPWKGDECHRLQIMKKTGPNFGDEENMGGRNKDSIIEIVIEIIEDLKANAHEMPPR